MSVAQYARFLLVGGVVGLITVACREVIGFCLGADSAFNYSTSVVLSYAIGTFSSFVLNHRVTFGGRSGGRDWTMFARFATLAVASLFATWILALTIRYGLSLDARLGRSAPAVALVVAALVSSLFTYSLSARFVFSARTRNTAGQS